MLNILSVGVGAFFGAIARYLISRLLPDHFPFATLASNIIAALLIGYIIGWERNSGALSEQMKLLLTTGMLGGLSTFSAFSLETVAIIESQKYFLAGANVLLNVALCITFVFSGLALAKIR